MPVTVAVDATGTSVHETGPREWQQRIGKIPVADERRGLGGARCTLTPPRRASAPGAPTSARSRSCSSRPGDVRSPTDSLSSLNLPRLRMGLLTKLNLLTIGLLFVTAIATSGFYLWQQWRDENIELHRRGAATLAMLAELAEFGLATNSPAPRRCDPRHVVRRQRHRLRRRPRHEARARRGPAHRRCDRRDGRPAVARPRCEAAGARDDRRLRRDDAGPALPRDDRAGRRHARRRATGLSPVTADAAKASTASAPAAATPIGYVRLGLTFDRIQQQFRKYLVGALSVTAMLIVLAIAATFAADARARRADAPADARGALGGRRQARRLRPGELLRRARAAHPYVQPHDAAARRIAGRSRQLSAHARGEGRPADEGARGRDRARVQARAARHPHRACRIGRSSISG